MAVRLLASLIAVRLWILLTVRRGWRGVLTVIALLLMNWLGVDVFLAGCLVLRGEVECLSLVRRMLRSLLSWVILGVRMLGLILF